MRSSRRLAKAVVATIAERTLSVAVPMQNNFRIFNNSDNAVAVKVRFREAENSRDVLDFIVVLSPDDAWSGWIDDLNAVNSFDAVIPGIMSDAWEGALPSRDHYPNYLLANSANSELPVLILSGQDRLTTRSGDQSVWSYDRGSSPYNGIVRLIMQGHPITDSVNAASSTISRSGVIQSFADLAPAYDLVEDRAGDDLLFGGNGADLIRGGDSDPYLLAGEHVCVPLVLAGEQGLMQTDAISAVDAGNGGDNDNILLRDAGDDRLVGDRGSLGFDQISGDQDDDELRADNGDSGTGDDIIYGSADADDDLTGGDGDDRNFGYADNEYWSFSSNGAVTEVSGFSKPARASQLGARNFCRGLAGSVQIPRKFPQRYLGLDYRSGHLIAAAGKISARTEF